jgi:signal transduction histidine kinase
MSEPSLRPGLGHLTPVQIGLSIGTGLLIVLVAILIVVGNVNITATNETFNTSYVIGDLVKIQRAILLLQLETNKLASNQDSLTFDEVEQKRAVLESQLRLAIGEAGGQENVTAHLTAIQSALVEFDLILEALKQDPTADRLSTDVSKMDAVLTELAGSARAFHTTEENRFFTGISSALRAQNRYENFLIALGVLLALVALGLVVSLRHTVSGQFAQAYRLLEAENQERKRVERELRQQNAYLAALHETTLGLISRLDVDELLEVLVKRAGNLMNAPIGFLYLGEPEDEEIELKVRIGIPAQVIGERVKPGEGLAGQVLVTGRPLVVEDYGSWSGRSQEINSDVAKASVAVPLPHDGLPESNGQRIVGVLGLAHGPDSMLTFGEQEVELLGRFAQLASIALDNARLFEEAEEARADAEQASQAKSVFLANMSHELRTPLNAIIGFTRIVKRRGEDLLPEKQVKNLDKVLVSAEHLLALVTAILEIAKIEAGRIDIEITGFDVAGLTESCIAAVEPLIDEDKVRLRKELQPDLPVAHSDPEKLRQILIAVLSNAAKYTSEGEIRVGVHYIQDMLVFEVADTGKGIPEEALKQIFHEFQQVDSSAKNEFGGAGLKLPISRKMARLLGGDLTVVSEEGRGSTFTLTVPLRYEPKPGSVEKNLA